MIQRIQTVYLFLAALTCGIGSFLLPNWDKMRTELAVNYDQSAAAVAYLIIAIIALVSIFLFKNRQRQMSVVKVDIILNLVLLGFFVYWTLSLPGDVNTSEKGIGILVPLISIVFLMVAHKAIKKDDDLVKSVDRFR